MAYVVDGAAFVGDTLFMPDVGTARAGFPGGDAHTLYRSMRRILSLPPETKMFVGQDYAPKGRSAGRQDSNPYPPATGTRILKRRRPAHHADCSTSTADFTLSSASDYAASPREVNGSFADAKLLRSMSAMGR